MNPIKYQFNFNDTPVNLPSLPILSKETRAVVNEIWKNQNLFNFKLLQEKSAAFKNRVDQLNTSIHKLNASKENSVKIKIVALLRSALFIGILAATLLCTVKAHSTALKTAIATCGLLASALLGTYYGHRCGIKLMEIPEGYGIFAGLIGGAFFPIYEAFWQNKVDQDKILLEKALIISLYDSLQKEITKKFSDVESFFKTHPNFTELSEKLKTAETDFKVLIASHEKEGSSSPPSRILTAEEQKLYEKTITFGRALRDLQAMASCFTPYERLLAEAPNFQSALASAPTSVPGLSAK